MVVAKLPVYMRIGDLPEHKIGTIDLEGEMDGANFVLKPIPLAEFLRGAADAAEAANGQ
ncbi:MAG: hypothetical protein ACRDP5_15880 [Streptosporangiaceae bacterium]